MSSQTPNINLTLPTGAEKVSRQIINDNNTKIDTAIGTLNSKIDTIDDYTAYGPTYCFLKRKTNVIFIYGSSSGGLTLTGDNAWHSLTTIGPAFRPSYDVYFVGSTASGHSIAFNLATDGTLNYVTDANTSYWSYGGSYVI